MDKDKLDELLAEIEKLRNDEVFVKRLGELIEKHKEVLERLRSQ